ncbi:MAG: dihydroorotase [Planctomycetota bacterium]|nr:dihydroorotase [Planctomycetota bacterium]
MSSYVRIIGAASLLDPASGVDGPGEIWIRDDVIVALGAGRPALGPDDEVRVLDAAGTTITPMFVDIHVHLREPGGEESETIRTGTAAALRGGYCTLYAMANTAPTCDRPEVLRTVIERAREAGPVEVVPVSSLSVGLRGRELVDLEANAAAGAGAFSDDGAWLADERLALEALRWAGRNGAVVMQHCEDFELTGSGVLHACSCVQRAGLPGIARDAEDRAVARDIRLAAEAQSALHVCHVSTAGAVAAIRGARAEGLPVSGEVTPHHLVLTAADAVAGGPDFKMKPPLREQHDVDALIEALADGTLDAVATDHAPHSEARKAGGFLTAPFGAIGVETAFPVLFTQLVQSGRLPLRRLVHALTAGPCRVVRRVAPRLVVGAVAQLNFLDLVTTRPVDRAALASRSQNCPFHGQLLAGWPAASWLGGVLHLHGEPGCVRYRTLPGGAGGRKPPSGPLRDT